MEYNVQIVLDIFCDSLNVEAVASSLPVQPDHISKKGSRNPKLVIPRNDILSFSSKASKWASDLEEHWKSISEMASANKDRFSELSQDAEIKITVVVDHKGRFPSLYMPKEFVQFAGNIGAIIDVDVYEENIDEA